MSKTTDNMPRIIVVHGWEGSPEEGWFPWLKRELEKKGFEVLVPAMPKPTEPKIETWVPYLAKVVGTPDENTYFVGHSIGCQTITRYLETLPGNTKIGGAVFVAGFFSNLILGETEEKRIAEPWLQTPINFRKVRSHLPGSVAIFSDNDPFVPFDNIDDFRDKLGSEIITENGKGHFSGGMDKCFELPVALESVIKLAQDGK